MTGTRRKIMAALAVLVLVGASASAAQGSGDDDTARTRLIGLQEVPSISTVGVGTFRARMVSDDAFTFRLTYNRLESPITQSHIHFGQRHVAGGISVFLCSNLGNGPAGTAPCPGTTSGEVTGTITADDVIGPGPQGITVGEFDELVRAIRAGATYANVHTTTFPAGEIRGQIPRHHH
jgi:CHRD domain-containing protein